MKTLHIMHYFIIVLLILGAKSSDDDKGAPQNPESIPIDHGRSQVIRNIQEEPKVQNKPETKENASIPTKEKTGFYRLPHKLRGQYTSDGVLKFLDPEALLKMHILNKQLRFNSEKHLKELYIKGCPYRDFNDVIENLFRSNIIKKQDKLNAMKDHQTATKALIEHFGGWWKFQCRRWFAVMRFFLRFVWQGQCLVSPIPALISLIAIIMYDTAEDDKEDAITAFQAAGWVAVGFEVFVLLLSSTFAWKDGNVKFLHDTTSALDKEIETKQKKLQTFLVAQLKKKAVKFMDARIKGEKISVLIGELEKKFIEAKFNKVKEEIQRLELLNEIRGFNGGIASDKKKKWIEALTDEDVSLEEIEAIRLEFDSHRNEERRKMSDRSAEELLEKLKKQRHALDSKRRKLAKDFLLNKENDTFWIIFMQRTTENQLKTLDEQIKKLEE